VRKRGTKTRYPAVRLVATIVGPVVVSGLLAGWLLGIAYGVSVAAVVATVASTIANLSESEDHSRSERHSPVGSMTRQLGPRQSSAEDQPPSSEDSAVR
jgi:hypothetical protein